MSNPGRNVNNINEQNYTTTLTGDIVEEEREREEDYDHGGASTLPISSIWCGSKLCQRYPRGHTAAGRYVLHLAGVLPP